MAWETVIGLEVHVQLCTQSKIFSGAGTMFGAEPNTQTCEVDIALPGVLPVMNKEAALMAVKFGIAIGANVNRRSIFARKNYFYPDLPKGYQISQYELPIVSGGSVDISTPNGNKTIRITRAHLEEDAGKLLHQQANNCSGVDLNRAGTPLLEIVSEPDMRSPSEAIAYLKKIHTLVRYLKICDGNMQEGSFRCDANVSVRPKRNDQFGTRCEIKNLNSFRNIEKSINFEVKRHIDVLKAGGNIAQETRLYDANNDLTRSMRSKEEAHDYRYFPDPDLPPLVISDDLFSETQALIPELPDHRYKRFISSYHLNEKDAEFLTSDREIADYFEQVVLICSDSRKSANWITGELLHRLNQNGLDIKNSKIAPPMLGELIQKINDGTISGKIAKDVFDEMWRGEGDANSIIETNNLGQISNTDIVDDAIDKVIENHATQVQQYLDGQSKVFGFLVGKVMQATAGKANPQLVNQILKTKLTRKHEISD